MTRKSKKLLTLPDANKNRVPLPNLSAALLVADNAESGILQTPASAKAAAMRCVSHATQRKLASTDSRLPTVPQLDGACTWGDLFAPALLIIGSSLPQQDAVMLRLVCKAWAGHLGEVVTEAAPAPYPLHAHETVRKPGMHLTSPPCCLYACCLTPP